MLRGKVLTPTVRNERRELGGSLFSGPRAMDRTWRGRGGGKSIPEAIWNEV